MPDAVDHAKIYRVALYDEYEPAEDTRCPWCGDAILGRWQGSGGPSVFLVWRQGMRYPVGQLSHEDERPIGVWAVAELSEDVEITTFCPQGHCVTGEARVQDRVWVELDLAAELAKVKETKERLR